MQILHSAAPRAGTRNTKKRAVGPAFPFGRIPGVPLTGGAL